VLLSHFIALGSKLGHFHVRFVVDQVAIEQICLQFLQFSLPILHFITDPYSTITVPRGHSSD
jgi:hypothetical protein